MTDIIAIMRWYNLGSRLSPLESNLKRNSFRYTSVTPDRSSAKETVAAAQGRRVVCGSRNLCKLYQKGGHRRRAGRVWLRKLTEILDDYGPNPISLKLLSLWHTAEQSHVAMLLNLIHAPVLLDTSGPYKSYSGDLLLVDSNKPFSGTPLVISSDGPYQSFSGTPLLLNSNGPYKSFSKTPLLYWTQAVFTGRSQAIRCGSHNSAL